MADFTSLFWSGFIGSITLVSIIALLWFIWDQSRGKRPQNGSTPETMGHKWDGDLEEYNNPLPKWWLNLFYITLWWGLGYLIAYPGLGAFEGVLAWSQESQYEQEISAAEDKHGALYAEFTEQKVEALAGNEKALAMGRNLFASYCIQCHGADAGGARGFPNLADQDWLWGGSPEAIETSIKQGRQGLMPAWSEVIGEDGVQQAADYVEHLAGRNIGADKVAQAKETYNATCAVCHGAEGEGNPMMGAPRLSDDIWLYGGSRKQIVHSIAQGRGGKMPANGEFLGPSKTRLLAAYVYSLSKE